MMHHSGCWVRKFSLFTLYKHFTAMASRNNANFVKLRHKSSVFTRANIEALEKVLEKNDLISVVFLICGIHQIDRMCKFLNSDDCYGVASQDLYKFFQKFPQWEDKLPAALGAIKHYQALQKLDISPKDLQYYHKIKDSHTRLCSVRLALYRIFEALTREDSKELVGKMVELGAPPPPGDSLLELHFMLWHSQGFLNIERRESLKTLEESLKSCKPELAGSLTAPQLLFVNYEHDELPSGVYDIKNPSNPGLCVIINQVNYGGSDDRISSIFNSDELQHLMERLNFSVVHMQDLTESEFCDKIKTTVSNSFSTEHSIFILIIMGHGGPEGVFCPPGNSQSSEKGDRGKTNISNAVRVEDIQNSLFKCMELRRIPKVLILNACRGKFVFSTRDFVQMETDAPTTDEDHPHDNIITCYSALPDFVSGRFRQKGSPFINLFCDILTKRPDIEICELFTLMNARLMRPTADISEFFTPGRYGYKHKVAMPFQWTSSLWNRLHLKLPETASNA